MRPHPILPLLLGTLGALLLALLIVIVGLRPPSEDVRVLLLLMGASGGGTVLALYIFYQQVLVTWVKSLRWTLIGIVLITVLLVFLNVWGTAQLMFINNHDLILTTALLVFGGLTAVMFGMFIANGIVSKIQKIAGGIENLARGKLDTRIHIDGQDELARLAQLLNWMGHSLQEIEAEKQRVESVRRDLIAWISHDLRTPLTAIQVSLEAIKDGIVSEPDGIEEYIGQSLSEVDNLRVLIDDLFAIAQMDAGHINLHFMKASLSDLISDTVSGMMPRAQHQQVHIEGDIATNIDPVYMAPDKIQRVLYNLIDNAIRHTPRDGTITIRAARCDENVCVDVHNTGSVISDEHLPRIFEKFYRGEDAREQSPDGHRGTGLGLAIARGFIEAHRGSIRVESNPDIGTRFSFTLPA